VRPGCRNGSITRSGRAARSRTRCCGPPPAPAGWHAHREWREVAAGPRPGGVVPCGLVAVTTSATQGKELLLSRDAAPGSPVSAEAGDDAESAGPGETGAPGRPALTSIAAILARGTAPPTTSGATFGRGSTRPTSRSRLTDPAAGDQPPWSGNFERRHRRGPPHNCGAGPGRRRHARTPGPGTRRPSACWPCPTAWGTSVLGGQSSGRASTGRHRLPTWERLVSPRVPRPSVTPALRGRTSRRADSGSSSRVTPIPIEPRVPQQTRYWPGSSRGPAGFTWLGREALCLAGRSPAFRADGRQSQGARAEGRRAGRDDAGRGCSPQRRPRAGAVCPARPSWHGLLLRASPPADYSRSEPRMARLGAKSVAAKISGGCLLLLHRKAANSSSAASKAVTRLEYRAFADLQGCDVQGSNWQPRSLSVPFDRPRTLLPSTTTIERAAHDARRVHERFLCHFQKSPTL